MSLLFYGIPLQFQSVSSERNIHMTKLWVQQHPEEVLAQSPRTERHLQLLHCQQLFHSIQCAFCWVSRHPVAHLPCSLSSDPQPQGPWPWPCVTLTCQHPLTTHGMGNQLVLAQGIPQNIRLFLWSSAGIHGIATETRYFFSFNIAFHAHLINNGTSVQRGIYSLNYWCQSKANHAVNSTMTQMTNNFKGKENQDFAAYSVLFQETDKRFHILVLSVLHFL